MAKLRKSSEEYLEAILVLKREKGVVHSVDIAHYMDYSKPSVSRAVGNLRQAGYLEMAKNGELTLTESGMRIAAQILERHSVLTAMFASLGVPPAIATEDACEVEHVISETSFNCIKQRYAEAATQAQTAPAPFAEEDAYKDEKKKKKKKKKG